MTQADSTVVLRMSLDSDPTQGQGQAATDITATTPLPKGWGSFCSRPYEYTKNGETVYVAGRWYATAPWHVDTLSILYGHLAVSLEQTVCAETWPELHIAVSAQVDLHADMMVQAAARGLVTHGGGAA